MTAYDPLASLVVPVPPYRGRGAVLPQVRLASTDGPPGRSEDDILQAGSALEAQDQAARAAEDIAEQPKPNPLENMALSLAIEQQEEAVRQEAGQAHTSIDKEPPLSDTDIAAKQEAHTGITHVEGASITDIAGVGEQLPPSEPEAPPVEVAPAPLVVPVEAPLVSPAQQEKRGESFQLQKAREALKAVADAEFRYNQAQIDYLSSNLAGRKDSGILNGEAQVLATKRDIARHEFREFATGLNEADREAIAAQEAAVQRGVESREREVENILIAIENKVSEKVAARPPLPPVMSPEDLERARRPQAEAVPVEAAPAVAAQERQEPTPQQQIEELRNQVAELTRRLNAPPRPTGAEAAPAVAQELGAAAAGGAEGPPQEPEFGPEQPETGGASEQAMEAIDGVRELGSDQELGFWERKGMQAESALFDVGAWWAGAWAVRAKNSQKGRERKIRSLERAAQRSAKTFVGSLLNPLKYGWRINYHRWREGIVRAASERHNDKRTRYETARNDVLSRVAAQMEVPLRTAENRAEQNRQLLEQADADVARLHGVLSAIAIRQRVAQGPELDALLERHAGFVEQLREAEEARNTAYQAYGDDNAKAGRIQRINNQILKKQNPGDRPQVGSVPREVLRPRAPVPLPRAPAA